MRPEEISKLLKKLSSIRGRHTELITVYIPAGANILAISKQLEAEKSTASNIKSKVTRKNVIEALEKIVRELKGVKKTPENGLVIFCGNTAKKEGQQNIEFFALEPHVPINIKMYRCDQKFLTEPLRELVEKHDKYGLLVLDRHESTFGLLDGKTIIPLSHHTSEVPGKIKAGGQSAARFARIREEVSKAFFKRTGERLIKEFGEASGREIKGILIGGPGPTKEDFLAEADIGKLREKIIAVEDIGYADESGLELLVEKAQTALEKAEITKEKNLLKDFFELLGKNKEKVAYGEGAVRKALQSGAVEKLLISEEFDEKNNALSKEFQKMAKDTAAEIVFISTETEEGISFMNLSGIGAFLRFST
ncbi:peptide chain release factor 1 [Candidatus Pacearchaeota archaeon ex4484_26]|nr:MAG: peptide chain release factor 1 [Candidatus Pacearchaeota archaeon ex4484_26]